MGMSRRQFTREFKLTALKRLEQGVSVGEVARALEVDPNVLHRWRREFREGPGNVFPGNGQRRWSEGRIPELEEVYRSEYRDIVEARTGIREFLEKVYNQKRLHSALGYVPPVESERGLLAQKEAAARHLSL